MAKRVRGGKRRCFRNQHPGGGGEPYRVEVIEVYMRFRGKSYRSSYSISRHGIMKANQLANDWLEWHRALVEQLEAES
jgi:hypothetical protein